MVPANFKRLFDQKLVLWIITDKHYFGEAGVCSLLSLQSLATYKNTLNSITFVRLFDRKFVLWIISDKL